MGPVSPEPAEMKRTSVAHKWQSAPISCWVRAQTWRRVQPGIFRYRIDPLNRGAGCAAHEMSLKISPWLTQQSVSPWVQMLCHC